MADMNKSLALVALTILLFARPVLAQVSTSADVRAHITNIERLYDVNGYPQAVFDAEDEQARLYHVDTAESYQEGLRYDIKKGDEVYLVIQTDTDGSQHAFLADVVRSSSMIWIVIIFCVLTLAVGWWRGLFALIGLTVTLAILFLFVLPQILNGADPVATAVIAGILILAVNMHLSHGISLQTFAAFGSTVIGLFLAFAFAKWFVVLAHLSGLASEDALYVYWQTPSAKSPVGLLLAGILLSATGVLDDVAITQNETVAELKHANPELNANELFVRAMRVGRHHIASTVNTLVLAYAGVALPLFILFLSQSGVSAFTFINKEAVAEEVVRTVSGTCALVLTVPISTAIAAWVAKKGVHKHA